METHNHAQDTFCTERCPAYGTPREALVPHQETETERLRLVAQADASEARTEAEDRDSTQWRLHVEGSEAATFHNNALATEHAGKAQVFTASANAIHALTTMAVLYGLAKALRKVLGR